MLYFELSPAYGRDYKTKAEVINAFVCDCDFQGDYQLGFQTCNRADLLAKHPKGFTVNLRYKANRSVAVHKVVGA
jgi:hypothetical protein